MIGPTRNALHRDGWKDDAIDEVVLIAVEADYPGAIRALRNIGAAMQPWPRSYGLVEARDIVYDLLSEEMDIHLEKTNLGPRG